ncbi:hypothetical protein BJ085DRAFT_29405 [Dimargaris cristalligena]|uniref:F-box domain-containing protein n=1 Tax=Dimargaris cristalligena TaxID=215637 RepID=A0A4P9ZUJ2_9FUNG|nr:hypothetical protein BJ085DRAFT_29405 [Dimargaris cristalligena]|eukprot:RKP37215.1 hypothetical protein BJ085DRAFT_29405 [Dimargaris cristalligena]
MQPLRLNILVLTSFGLSLLASNHVSASESSRRLTKWKKSLKNKYAKTMNKMRAYAPGNIKLDDQSSEESNKAVTSVPGDKLTSLPNELLNNILDLAIEPGSFRQTYPGLMLTSKAMAAHVLAHPSGAILPTYHKLQVGLKHYRASGVFKVRKGTIVPADKPVSKLVSISRNFKNGVKQTFNPWQELLYHQFATTLWRSASRFVSFACDIVNTDGVARLNPHENPLTMIYLRETLAIGRDLKIFQKGAPHFIDPNQLTQQTLEKQLPLLALVDTHNNATDLLQVFDTLVDPSFDLLIHRDWVKPSDSKSDYAEGPLRNIIRLRQVPTFSLFSGVYYWDLFDTLAAIIMARLALTGQYDLFRSFISSIQSIDNSHHPYGGLRFGSPDLGKLAVMLSAMTRQKELVCILPHDFLGRDLNYGLTVDIPESNCFMADEMRQMGLITSARFLEETLECADYESDEPSETGGQRPELDSRPLRQLRLVDSGETPQMGVPVIISEFDVDTRNALTDLGPWEHDELWEYGQLLAKQQHLM